MVRILNSYILFCHQWDISYGIFCNLITLFMADQYFSFKFMDNLSGNLLSAPLILKVEAGLTSQLWASLSCGPPSPTGSPKGEGLNSNLEVPPYSPYQITWRRGERKKKKREREINRKCLYNSVPLIIPHAFHSDFPISYCRTFGCSMGNVNTETATQQIINGGYFYGMTINIH